MKNRHELNVYFGVPGSGKTTFAAWLTKRATHKTLFYRLFCEKYPTIYTGFLIQLGLIKMPVPVFSNVPITGAFQLDVKRDVGIYHMENAKVIIDEAGIEYNNRNFKALPAEQIYWYKYHRHYRCSVDVFSQSHEDMDITLRRLAQKYYVVKKSILPHFVVVKRIKRRVGIDDATHQIVDEYYWGIPIVETRWIYSRPLWKLFNSYSSKRLTSKVWQEW